MQKLGLAIFLVAVVFALGLFVPDFGLVYGPLFLIVLPISALVFVVGLVHDRKRLRRREKVFSLLVICFALIFYVPVVQTDNGGLLRCQTSTGPCVNTLQFESATTYLWCFGAGYQYNVWDGPSVYLMGACVGGM
jgi:UDP-N-acetylmuramyl pentapeptide phosphotransferase/UDP-N-acetylglucosamine-1-phosphate transferase